jgi:hypothetical protein
MNTSAFIILLFSRIGKSIVILFYWETVAFLIIYYYNIKVYWNNYLCMFVALLIPFSMNLKISLQWSMYLYLNTIKTKENIKQF